jgi:RNA recognition motif-containing protein
MVKLFIVGYPLDIQDAELMEICSIHGTVHSIELLRERATGKLKGFGFIEMEDQSGADRVAAAVNGMVIRGRKLKVKLAEENRGEKPKTTKTNIYPSDESRDGLPEEFATKRPRKLVSHTFRASD